MAVALDPDRFAVFHLHSHWTAHGAHAANAVFRLFHRIHPTRIIRKPAQTLAGDNSSFISKFDRTIQSRRQQKKPGNIPSRFTTENDGASPGIAIPLKTSAVFRPVSNQHN
jgi:hypothetical protein